MQSSFPLSARTWTAESPHSPTCRAAQLPLSERVEISFVTAGSGILHLLDAVSECRTGELFVFDSGLPHGFFARDDGDMPTVCTLSFSPEELFSPPYANREKESFCYGIFRDMRPSSYAMLNGQATKELLARFASLSNEAARRDFEWQSAAIAHLTLFLLTVARYLRLADTVDMPRHTLPTKEQTVVSYAMREILSHFSDSTMTLDTIAATLFISRSHLSRMFKRVTGSRFTDYVRDIRLTRACDLLRTTRLSNEEIVHRCGLRDVPSFYRLFKTHTGMTPYQYRLTKHTNKGEETMSIYTEISENLQKGKAKVVKELVAQAIEEGLPAGQILNEGLVSGMNVLGEKFKNNEVYVPEVLVAARAMNVGMQLLKPLLIEDGIPSSGKVCIGTVQGDLHDIGKNLVKMMMEGKGLEVIDLGTDVSPEKFVQTAIDENCRIICCSALLTTTMDVMAAVVRAAEAAGIRDKVKIMIGGAPITEEFCRTIGADCYTSDAASAADAAVELCRA